VRTAGSRLFGFMLFATGRGAVVAHLLWEQGVPSSSLGAPTLPSYRKGISLTDRRRGGLYVETIDVPSRLSAPPVCDGYGASLRNVCCAALSHWVMISEAASDEFV
jgi:hypothetical protein